MSQPDVRAAVLDRFKYLSAEATKYLACQIDLGTVEISANRGAAQLVLPIVDIREDDFFEPPNWLFEFQEYFL